MGVSPQLQAAQARLHALRSQFKTVEDGEIRPKTPLPSLPQHLGWHTDSIANLLRSHRTEMSYTTLRHKSPCHIQSPHEWGLHAPQNPIHGVIECSPLISSTGGSLIRIQPDLAIAVLQAEQSAVARVWWLLRALDVEGRGTLSLVQIKAWLSEKDSPWRIFGWRQCRNLLQQGKGIFWERDKTHVWLRSTAKVAVALGIERFKLAPVEIPIKQLQGKMGAVRANLYALLHAGRPDRPIARDTISAITGISPTSQRRYEKMGQVRPKFQYALQAPSAPQEAHWEFGNRTFILEDRRGRFGNVGQQWRAIQLPNCYTTTHKPLKPSRNRALNRRLADLLQYGTTGNDQAQERLYCDDAKMALKCGSLRYFPSVQDGYWHCLHTK